MAAFILSSHDDEIGEFTHGKRLVSFGGTVSGSKLILSLKVEVSPCESGYVLEALEAIRASHNPKPKMRGAK